MGFEIKTVSDWHLKKAALTRYLHKNLSYKVYRDFKVIIENINKIAIEIELCEISVRNNPSKANKNLELNMLKFKNTIDDLEDMILFQKLLS